MTLSAGAKLGRYEIRSQLGVGGMGEVYLAEDMQLGRRVAIKLLPAHTASDERAGKRLVREARAAATLDHPNICSIYEVGEEDGRSFIAMQYVEGETLDLRLRRKPVELKESLTLASQIADALTEAHTHGIIHRDIKPSNIIVTSRGQAKVMDFGLAKIIEQPHVVKSEAETEVVLSTPGAIIGTVPYMSPEQVRGEALDARSDIFSFGVVFYEMLSGQQPFASKSSAATVSAILTREPLPVARFVPEAPAELDRIVRKCLEKDRQRRYQTMRDLAIDLDNCRQERDVALATTSLRGETTGGTGVAGTTSNAKRHRFLPPRLAFVAGTFLVVAAASVIAYVLVSRRAATEPPLEIKSVAVLPLKNLSGDPAQEYFADGMTEALIRNLAQIRALKVISRTSVMRYKGSDKSLPEIAAELNVDAIIEGSVQREGGRVRVTTQLIHAATDAHLWARDYDRDLTDVLKLQSEVARAVADEIRIQVTAEERARLASARTVNPQAHEAYLLGRFHLIKRNEEDLKQSIEYFERATQLAPDYAAAYASLSEAWLQRGIFGAKGFKEVESPSRAAALKASSLDEQLAEAHTSLATIKFTYDWDWAGAELEFRRALELDSGNPDVHIAYGHLLMALGRHDEAIKEGERAEQLDPLSSNTQSALGRFLYRARKYAEAVPHLERAVELEPRSIPPLFRLGDVYAELGKYDEAIAAFKKIGELKSDREEPALGVARVYALMGREREARQMISNAKGSPPVIAAVYAALGDKDAAFRILEKAVEERNSLLVYFKEDPHLENLHSDPRWKALLRRMNFPLE